MALSAEQHIVHVPCVHLSSCVVYNIDVHTACGNIRVIFQMLSCLAVNVLCLSGVDVSFCVALYCSSLPHVV